MIGIKKYLKEAIGSNVILRNLFSLSILHVLGMVLPLITYPYLIRIVGIDNFGKVNFVLSLLTFAIMVIDFGYSYIGPKEISVNRNDNKRISEIFTRIVLSKILLLVAVALISMSFIALAPEPDHKLYLFSLVYLTGLALNPAWFFQGIEKMHFITIFDSVAKVISTILVFITITKQSHIVYYLPILGLGSLLSCGVGYYHIFSRHSIRFTIPAFKMLLNEYRKGFPIFIGQLSMHLLSNANIILLGFLSTSYFLGLYSVADKIAKIPWAVSGIMSTVLFPMVCKQTLNGLDAVWIGMKKYLMLLVGFIIIVVMGGIVFKEPLIHIFYKSDTTLITPPYIVLMLNVVIVTLNIPLNLILLAYSRNIIYMRLFAVTTVIHFILSIILIKYYGIFGASISTLLTYSILLLLLFWAYRRERAFNNLVVVNNLETQVL